MNKTKLARLDRIYSRIPEVNCKGLCESYCCVVMCSPLERKRIEKKTGVDVMGWTESPLEQALAKPCELLKGGRCSAYAVRPAICRLFGAVATPMLACPHGCAPAIPLSDEQSRAILGECDALMEPAP